MRLLPGHAQSEGAGLTSRPQPARASSEHDAAEEMFTREDPGLFAGHALPRDPYAAWLEQRRRERAAEERTTVRWVHRGPALRAVDARRRGDPRTSADDRLVGV